MLLLVEPGVVGLLPPSEGALPRRVGSFNAGIGINPEIPNGRIFSNGWMEKISGARAPVVTTEVNRLLRNRSKGSGVCRL